MDNSIFNQDFWNNRYKTGNTGWNIGYVSTPLKDYFDQLNDRTISILIPGGGNGHEAAYLLSLGFTNITIVDIAPLAIQQLSERFGNFVGKEIQLICTDFFALEGKFTLIVEQTFFCALDPKLRPDYVKKMGSLLEKEGKLVGLLFNTQFESSPPFGGSLDEYIPLFSTSFLVKKLEPCFNSIPQRNHSELFLQAILVPAD